MAPEEAPGLIKSMSELTWMPIVEGMMVVATETPAKEILYAPASGTTAPFTALIVNMVLPLTPAATPVRKLLAVPETIV